MKLLHIDSAITGDASISRSISRAVVEKCLEERSDIEVIYRDLAANPVGHLTAACFGALCGQGEAPTDCAEDVRQAEEIIAEFTAADMMVLGVPMYNYSIPTQLRTYLDRLFLAGRTFRYTEAGHVGLLHDRPVIICSSRGGVYGSGSHYAHWDHHEPYLRALFDLVGITNLHFIHADGVALGDHLRATAIASAMTEAQTRAHIA